MGTTIATSGGSTRESKEEAFSGQSLFIRLATSCARVLFRAPGGPASPTKSL
uniref:Uncharacterized protein n=1 Tax=Glycine max TaxID=3847 RepID=C6TAI0_SOYBN|nr:unknown [Glycine max]